GGPRTPRHHPRTANPRLFALRLTHPLNSRFASKEDVCHRHSKPWVPQAVNLDLGEATESIDTQTFPTQEQFVAGFNTHYLLDALETMPGENCDLHMDNPLAPCVLTTRQQPAGKHIVMPVRVSSHTPTFKELVTATVFSSPRIGNVVYTVS